MDLFATPRKLVKSLQIPTDDCSENQSRRFRSPSSSKFNWSPNSDHDLNESFTNEDEQFKGTSESVSSSDDIIQNVNNNNVQPSQEPVPEAKMKSKSQILFPVSIASGLFVLLIAVVCFLWIRDVEEGYNLVPT